MPADFGCVIGVDRSGYAMALCDAGAHVVVTHLVQVQVAVDPPSTWSLAVLGISPGARGYLRSLVHLGNVDFATRAAAAWAGMYPLSGDLPLRRLQSAAHHIANRVTESEDLVNRPTWLALEFRIAEQDVVRCPNLKLPSDH